MKLSVCAAAFAMTLTFCPLAFAQVRWDATLLAGVSKAVARTAGAEPNLGATLSARAHVAVIPLIRAGAYITTDFAGVDGGGERFLGIGGLQVRATSPMPRGNWRVSLFTGVGAGLAHRTAGGVGSLSGRLFEVPVGMSVSYALRKPWSVTTEVGSRFGFGFAGSVYDAAGGGAIAKEQVLLYGAIGLTFDR